MPGIFDDLLGTLRNTFQIGNGIANTKSIVMKRGAFLYTLIFNHASSQSVEFPDDSGQVSLIDAAAQTFVAAVPFRKARIAHQTQTISGPITFTIGAGTKLPGAVAYYRLIGDGISTINVDAFKVVNTDTGFNPGLNVLNVVKFTFDGTDHWVEIWQEKGVLPSFQSIGLPFPVRAGNTITNVGNIYTPASSAGNFDSFMSGLAIPQWKAGRVTVKVQDITMVALCDTAIAESWATNNFEYFIWRGTSTAFSGTLGTPVVDSGVAMTNPGWLRLTRASTGVVTAECSSDGINWTLFRTYATTTLVPLWVTCNLSGLGQKTLEVIAFEVEP
jgi:hypothetical protein